MGGVEVRDVDPEPLSLTLSHLSEAELKVYVRADNNLALNAGWDRETLTVELQSLIDIEFDVEQIWHGKPGRVG